MKRWIAILTLLCALVLTGCGRETSVDGTVTAVDYDEDGIMTALTLCTSDGKTEQVELTESTGLFSWVEGTDRADIRPEMTVRVEGERKDGVWQADWVSITGGPEHGAAVLADGTVVDALHRSWGEKVYQLPDGTQLLRVNDTVWPEDVVVGGVPVNYDDLSPAVQTAVSAYFHDQGVGYDEQAELERAYEAYCADPEQFSAYVVGQNVSPCGASERVIYYETDVTLPVSSGVITGETTVTAFDRETGAVIPAEDLFTCTRSELIAAVLDAAGVTEQPLRREAEAAFRLEYLRLSDTGIDIQYPMGTVPSQEHSWGIFQDYDETILSLIQPWAVPERNQ